MSEIISTEYRVARHELTDEEVEKMKRRMASLHGQRREKQKDFDSFRQWAEPRIAAAFDPDYESKELEGVAPLTDIAAHGLEQELVLRRGVRAGTVSSIKAEIAALKHAVANRYEYRRIECDVIADVDKAEVYFVSKQTGEEVDRRAMTGDERQLHLPGTSRSKRKNAKARATDAVR